ncbi:MAG: hypothetical protein ACJAZN_003495 [Planctomycetota bacterium]|jgi:hypothetical protein
MATTSLLALAIVLASSAPGPIQATAPLALAPDAIPSAVRHAGIYHATTGTWTRTGGHAAFGPDVVYSNTAPTGYFYNCESPGANPYSLHFDEGGLPGTTNPSAFTGTPDRDRYTINGFSIGYCDLGAPGSSGWSIDFYESYTPCTLDTSPDETIVLTGLPAGGGCWTVDIDLSSGLEFCMQADGGPDHPGWDDDPSLDSFGWSFRYAGAPTPGAGFLLAGNPDVTSPVGQPTGGGNTYYETSLCAGVGSGYLARDFWWIEDPAGVVANCFFFGGYSNSNGSCAGPSNPAASFHMELVADVGECDGLCDPPYCLSEPTSTGLPAELKLFGSPVVANDDMRLVATGVPAQSFGFFITSLTQFFESNPGGSQGNLCVGGSIGRFVGPGQVMSSGTSGAMVLDTAAGLWSVRFIPTPTGSYAASPGMTTYFQLWFRDSVNGFATSNFSHGAAVTWE